MRLRRLLWAALVGGLYAIFTSPYLPLPAPPDAARVVKVDVVAPYPALLAAFRTPLQGGETGRVENISLAASVLDGFEIERGSVFSFNEVVGPRDVASGFVTAPEIYNGEYVMGIGGGVCQVSSTLYNVALMTGMEIWERMHHSRPLSYVPLGRDATVSYGELDFSFRNPWPFAVQLRTTISNGHLEIQMWGEERLPHAVQVETLSEAVIMPDLVITPDPSLPQGMEVLADEGLPGWRVEVHRVVLDGESIQREVVSFDEYPSRPQRVRIGGP